MVASIPAPDKFHAKLDDIADAVRRLGPMWRWLEPSAFSPRHRGTSGSGSPSQRCGRCGGTGSMCGRCHGRLSNDGICPTCPSPDAVPVAVCEDCGGDGAFQSSEDRTGSIVVATERFRAKLRHAASEVEDAANRIAGAIADLNDASNLLDGGGSSRPYERSLPHPADQGDLALARAAQERRKQRAERSGDWSEVTG